MTQATSQSDDRLDRIEAILERFSVGLEETRQLTQSNARAIEETRQLTQSNARAIEETRQLTQSNARAIAVAEEERREWRERLDRENREWKTGIEDTISLVSQGITELGEKIDRLITAITGIQSNGGSNT